MVAAVGRRLLAAVSALAVMVLANACGSGPGSGAVIELTYVSYGGPVQDAMIAAWQEPYRAVRPNIRFVNTSPPDLSQLRAQVDSGTVGWTLVSTAPSAAMQHCGAVYERLEVPDLDADQFPPDLHGECHVAVYQNSLILAYNAAKWPDPATAPKTVQDFFDLEKFPGKRGALPDLQDGILEVALIADGVDPGALYPLDVDRALAKWATLGGAMYWAGSADELQGWVNTAQVDMQLQVQPRLVAALNAGAPFAPVWDVTMTSTTGLAIPIGAPYRAEAAQFMSYLLQPAQQARIAEVLGVAPVNLEAEPVWSENAAKVNAFGPANTGRTVAVDPVWWSQNWTETSTKFNTWRTPPA